MNSKVIYLFFVFAVCLVSALPHHQDGHDSVASEGLDGDVKVSPDTQGGHQATNNHFSTSKMDDEVSDQLSTVTDVHEETTTTTVTESLSSVSDDHHIISIPPEVPTTHKLDAKKDSKKKVKPLLKKKEKNFEFEESPDVSSSQTIDETTTHREIETTTISRGNLDTTTHVDTTSSILDTTTIHTNLLDVTATEEPAHAEKSDVLHKNMDIEFTTISHTEEETTPTESSMPTTTKNENLLSSDEQPPQTTIHENTMETTAVTTTTITTTTPHPTKTFESEEQTTQTPTTNVPETEPTEISNGLSIAEIEDHNSYADLHLHAGVESTETEDAPSVTTVVPPIREEDSKSDNNNMSNDLQDMQTTTSSSIDFTTEVTIIRKQKQMNLEGG